MRKFMVFFLIAILIFIAEPEPIIAQTEKNPPEVLILHNLSNEIQQEEVYMLDMLVGHFTSKITIMSMKEALEDESINNFTHLIYLGLSSEALSSSEISLLNQYSGLKYLIGNHLDALEPSKGVKVKDFVEIKQIYRDGKAISLEDPKSVMVFDSYKDVEAIFHAKSNNQIFPLIFKKNNTFYAPTQSISGILSEFIGESLFEFFKVKRSSPEKFLRLEDVHPKTNPEMLKEIGDYLAEHNIPYAITVIPVYTNPETKEKMALAEAVKLLKVLREMQENGASIILHGYYHQYRDKETGEGSEYWDLKYNRPIYQRKTDPVFLREDFSSEIEYQNFVKEGLKFEEEYIRNTIEKGVSDLVELGLYPIGFEAPHYSMSQSGYKVLSEYFSTYVGQIQISDETYEATYAPLYVTKPSKLFGMQLIPEGMGYIDPENPRAVEEMMEIAERISQFSDSRLSLFFHSYVGIEKFEEVMNGLEKYKEFDWLDLKSLPNEVKVEGIVIQTTNGKIKTERSINTIINHELKDLWWFIIPFFVFLAIILISLKAKKRKKRKVSIFYVDN